MTWSFNQRKYTIIGVNLYYIFYKLNENVEVKFSAHGEFLK